MVELLFPPSPTCRERRTCLSGPAPPASYGLYECNRCCRRWLWGSILGGWAQVRMVMSTSSPYRPMHASYAMLQAWLPRPNPRGRSSVSRAHAGPTVSVRRRATWISSVGLQRSSPRGQGWRSEAEAMIILAVA